MIEWIAEIERLAKLKANSILTEDDFQQAKQRLLIVLRCC